MKRSFYSIVFLSIIFQSCTEKITIDLDSSDIRCVIYGEFSSDTMAHKVRVSRSADYFSNKPEEPISGAIVTITDGTNIYPLAESLSEPGSYLTNPDVFGVPGNTYTINVTHVDLLENGSFSSYSATSTMKAVSPLDSIDAVYNQRWDGWEIKVWARDPVETKDFYLFKVNINGVSNADSLSNYIVTDDRFFNGSYTNGITIYFVEGRDTIKTGDKITAEICGINEDYYNFINEAIQMSQPQVPIFSGPPANIRTNFSNNAIGYFAAYSVARKDCFVKPQKKNK